MNSHHGAAVTALHDACLSAVFQSSYQQTPVQQQLLHQFKPCSTRTHCFGLATLPKLQQHPAVLPAMLDLLQVQQTKPAP
jgi:hypothetical protein